MPNPHFLQSEIEHMRRQVGRQRRQIRDLQRVGISAKPAEELLERMLAKVGEMCAERDRQVKEQRARYRGTDKIIRGAIERRIR